jgi:di/tricarboxylate transporter
MGPKNQGWAVSILVVAILWLGLLLGVSFLATPAKFLAPSLPLPVALDVGRHTFAIFNKVEWVLAVMLLLLVLVRARTWLIVTAAIAVALLVFAETVWLLPLLDQRVGLAIAGQQPPPSNYHNLYIGVEVAKLIGLGLVASVMARRLTRHSPNP